MSYTGADLIADGLATLGVTHVFGIVSIHNMPIIDAINRLGRTRIIDVRHEQGGTHAADGYARATGQLGVMIASTGPGTTNTVTGLYEAQSASSRVLVITGQVETGFYGKALGYVHEAENQLAMLRTVCRRAESPRHVDMLADAFNQVVDDMFTGRPAPGALEILIDIQYAQTSRPVFVTPGRTRFPGDRAALDAIVARLVSARRRVIVAGGGVIAAGAGDLLRELAERLDCPVFTSVDGRGALSEDHRLCVGNYYNSAGMYQAIADADVTLAVGTRFAVGVDGQFAKQTPPGELLHIDIDPAMIGRTHRAHIGVQADAALALGTLLSGLDEKSVSDTGSGVSRHPVEGPVEGNDTQFNNKVWTARDGVRRAMRKRLGADWPKVMDTLRAALPRDGVFVRDQTISAYNWGNQQFPIYTPRTTMNPSSGAIGPGLPLAIGAAIGSGKRTVVIHGDGGFMFHATELATAAQYRVPLLVCVFNDQGYGILRWLQDNRFGRINETDIGKMDFVTMAQSMGVPGERVTSVETFSMAVDRGMQQAGPYLIDIDMEHFAPMELSLMPKARTS